MTPPDDRRTITAREAEETLGIPAGTIRAWASTGKFPAVSIGRDGRNWYRLSDILEAAAKRRPRRRKKPAPSEA